MLIRLDVGRLISSSTATQSRAEDAVVTGPVQGEHHHEAVVQCLRGCAALDVCNGWDVRDQMVMGRLYCRMQSPFVTELALSCCRTEKACCACHRLVRGCCAWPRRLAPCIWWRKQEQLCCTYAVDFISFYFILLFIVAFFRARLWQWSPCPVSVPWRR